jgi:hypothetical protein
MQLQLKSEYFKIISTHFWCKFARYKQNCTKLIQQFKAAQNLTKDCVPDIRAFMKEYRVSGVYRSIFWYHLSWIARLQWSVFLKKESRCQPPDQMTQASARTTEVVPGCIFTLNSKDSGRNSAVFHHHHGFAQIEPNSSGSDSPTVDRSIGKSLQNLYLGSWLGRQIEDSILVIGQLLIRLIFAWLGSPKCTRWEPAIRSLRNKSGRCYLIWKVHTTSSTNHCRHQTNSQWLVPCWWLYI